VLLSREIVHVALPIPKKDARAGISVADKSRLFVPKNVNI
jgi:hypothetical protein